MPSFILGVHRLDYTELSGVPKKFAGQSMVFQQLLASIFVAAKLDVDSSDVDKEICLSSLPESSPCSCSSNNAPKNDDTNIVRCLHATAYC